MDLIIWSIVEVYTAIICASLVSLRPLIAKVIPNLFPTTRATADSKSRTNSSAPAWPLKVSSRLSGKLRSNNGTELHSDDEMTIDKYGKVTPKASVMNRESEDGSGIELSDGPLPFGNAHLEPEFQYRPK